MAAKDMVSIPENNMIPKAKQPLKRLSPGVYRNNDGNLVGGKGQMIPGSRPPSAMQSVFDALNRMPGQAKPSIKPGAGGQLNQDATAGANNAAGQVPDPTGLPSTAWAGEFFKDPKFAKQLEMVRNFPKGPSVADMVKGSKPMPATPSASPDMSGLMDLFNQFAARNPGNPIPKMPGAQPLIGYLPATSQDEAARLAGAIANPQIPRSNSIQDILRRR